MLSVARGLLGQPSVLLLDEPLEGLAPVICDQLMHALAQLDMTVILVEQQVDRAMDFADRVVSSTVAAWCMRAPPARRTATTT